MFCTIFQSEKTPFQATKTRSSKSPKIDIFPKGFTHGFCPKMAFLPTFFFQAIQARKMSFPTFQSEKKSFQAIKKRSSKGRKIDIFPKGLTRGMSPKIAIFPFFFFRRYRPGKSLLLSSRAKNTPFQAIKTGSSKRQKIKHFKKGLNHGFGPRMAYFPTFFFWQYRPAKCLLRYSRAKKRFPWLQKQEVQKVE